MVRYEIDAPPFGRLWKQGTHTKVRSGRVDLPGFEGAFDVVLRGTPEGPLPEQTAAMTKLVAESGRLPEQASAAMLETYRETGLDVGADAEGKSRVWSSLEPAFIEICDTSYYGDGRICILVAFASREEPEFVPAIETANGEFVDVLSGT